MICGRLPFRHRNSMKLSPADRAAYHFGPAWIAEVEHCAAANLAFMNKPSLHQARPEDQVRAAPTAVAHAPVWEDADVRLLLPFLAGCWGSSTTIIDR